MTDNDSGPEGLIPSDLVREDASFSDLVEEFLAGLPNRITRIEEALNAQNLEEARRNAHQLKGASGGYGYPALTELATRLEKEALDGQFDSCRAGVAQIKELIARLVTSL